MRRFEKEPSSNLMTIIKIACAFLLVANVICTRNVSNDLKKLRQEHLELKNAFAEAVNSYDDYSYEMSEALVEKTGYYMVSEEI